MATCGSCNKTFLYVNRLEQHQQATNHCYCRPCHRSFVHPRGLYQHNLEIHGCSCGKCGARFISQNELKQHQKSTGHCYCNDCSKVFVDEKALRSHLRATNHATEFLCCDCDRHFVNENALQQHLADKVHDVKRDRSLTLECPECNRKFKTSAALNQHKKSPAHRPLSNIKCFGSDNGRKCKARFTSPSALIQHLESGSCSSGLNREKLDDIVVAHDTDRIITQSDKDNLLKYGIEDLTRADESWSSDQSTILTPAEDSDSDSNRDLSLVPLTTRCPYCPPDHRPFLDTRSLQMHIDSPIHAPKIYRCPISLIPASSSKKFVMKSFSTLSGLAAHLESGACAGGKATLKTAVEYIEARLEEMGMKKVKLLL